MSLISAPRQGDRLAPRRRIPRELEGMAAEIPQGDSGRIPPPLRMKANAYAERKSRSGA